MPRSSRYQLRQPVTQTVFFAAATALRLEAIRRFGAGADRRARGPLRTVDELDHVRELRSATSISEKLPTGPFGPLSMKRFGKPGIETDRYAVGRGVHRSSRRTCRRARPPRSGAGSGRPGSRIQGIA